jgi:hypothetical protein
MKQLLYCLFFLAFTVPAGAQFLEQITVKEPLSLVQSRAHSDFAPDAVLTHAMFYGVEYQGVRLEMDVTNGKASGWVYRYYSPAQNASAWFVGVKVTILGYQAIKFDLDTLSNNVPVDLGSTPLGDTWVDSDAALQGSKDGGAETFLQQHPDTRMLLALIMNNPVQNGYVPMGQYWLLRYGSSTDTLTCLVHAETGLPFRCLSGNAPLITSLPHTVARVGEPYQYIVTAWGTPSPTYALTTSPAGMTLHPTSGVITWTPATGQEGPQNVTVTAVNPSGSDAQSFTIAVQGSATGPRITSTPVTEAIAGKPYTYQLASSASPPPQYALVESPQGMIIDAVRGTVYWSPTRAHAGAHNVRIKASNSGGDTEQAYVLEVYKAPIISAVSNKITGPNLPFWYSLEVDARPQPAFKLNAAPAGMEIDTAWGFITWTPTDAQLGTHVVLIQATNRAGMHQQSFEIVVDATVSVPDLSQPQSWKVASVWPSPARESANISVSTRSAGLLRVELFDALGRSVSSMTQDVHSGSTLLSLPTADLTNGHYLLRLSLNGETATRRLVIAR